MNKKVFVNQCGYITKAKKLVTFCCDEPVDFLICRMNSEEPPIQGRAEKKIISEAAGETNYIADISFLQEPGIYFIHTKGAGESDCFVIGDEVYEECLAKALKVFYLQRCGQELPKEYAGEYAHPCCHDTEALIYGTGRKKEVNGGWHDAGDYGRYVGPGAMAAAQLLLGYEAYEKLGEFYEGPVADKGVLPPILEEIKYELDWMLKMQNEKGELYHKVTCREFCGFVMPEKERDELVISPVSVTATADFAAVCAMAVRFYAPYDKAYADTLEKASRKAYEAMKHMDMPGGFHNPEEIVTGEYGDACDVDERYWAAAELYKAFGGEEYRKDFEAIAREKVYEGYGWEDMGSYGNIAYLSSGRELDAAVKEKIETSMKERGETLYQTVSGDGYGAGLKKEEYIWGSNLLVANNGLQLLDAYHLTGERKYYDAAWEQIHYLLGRNPMGICYVTGLGTHPVMKPHHRPSAAVGRPMPGMLSGGPCDWMADDLTKDLFEGKSVPPAKCFLDMTGSYSTNEITIYWNSALICLLAELLKEI